MNYKMIYLCDGITKKARRLGPGHWEYTEGDVCKNQVAERTVDKTGIQRCWRHRRSQRG